MDPLTLEEIERALEEAARSGNYFLHNAFRRLVRELNELKDQHAMARFAQEIEPTL